MRHTAMGLVLVSSIAVGQSMEIHWSRVFNNGTHDELTGVCSDQNEGIIAVGGSWNSSIDQAGQVVLRYDGYGNLIWSRVYSHPGKDGTFALDVVSITGQNEYMIVGTTDLGLTCTPDVFLSRYDSNGNRLETMVYSNYGFGTSIEMLSNGDFVIGAINMTPPYNAYVMLVDGDDLSNVLWTYNATQSFSDPCVAASWRRVYTAVTPNDEIIWGFTTPTSYSEFYGWDNRLSGIWILDTNGTLTDFVNASQLTYMPGNGVLTGLATGVASSSTTPFLVSVVTRPDFEYGLFFVNNLSITNGDAVHNSIILADTEMTFDAFSGYPRDNNAFLSTGATLFNCHWSTPNSFWIYGFSGVSGGQDPFIQKFSYNDPNNPVMLHQRIHVGDESIIRGPQFALGSGRRVGSEKHAIAMTIGTSSSSDCYVELWELPTSGGVTLASEKPSTPYEVVKS